MKTKVGVESGQDIMILENVSARLIGDERMLLVVLVADQSVRGRRGSVGN